MIFSFFYEIALHLYALFAIPYTLIKKKSFRVLFTRLGLALPLIEKGSDRLVWIHAVSLGEVKAITGLALRLKRSGVRVLFSTVTETGYKEAERALQEVDARIHLPFDFSYLIRKVVKKYSPDLLILTESDFWYNFQREVKKGGGKVLLVNGKLSERSFKRWSLIPFIAKKFFSTVDHFCVQTEEYKSRFITLGIDDKKVTTTGNIKLDNVMPILNEEERRLQKEKYAISEGDFILTLGSTHNPEESLWLSVIQQLWQKKNRLKIFLVPRHLERIGDITQLLEKKGIAFTRSSQGGNFKKGPLILVDEMGILLKLYQLSDLAFVGGSFTPKVGGHNLIEPASYGVCTLFGPHLHSQPGFAKLMEEYKAGIVLQPDSFIEVVKELIEKPSSLHYYGENGRKLVAASRGALEKTWIKVEELLPLKGRV